MRQKLRYIVIFLSLFLFPITLNYLSPYVSVNGAFAGILTGSVIVFGGMFLSGLIFGRAWCAWVCPIAGMSEMGMLINHRPVPVRKLRIIRYSIFAVWLAALVAGFILAGGIKSVQPFYLTENIVSVDEPLRYITYYFVLFLFFGLTIWIGRRGACHSVCWMSPFLVGGSLAGKFLHLPQFRIAAEPEKCLDCQKCDRKCPMSIAVNTEMKSGAIQSVDCILCGQCVDNCPQHALRIHLRRA